MVILHILFSILYLLRYFSKSSVCVQFVLYLFTWNTWKSLICKCASFVYASLVKFECIKRGFQSYTVLKRYSGDMVVELLLLMACTLGLFALFVVMWCNRFLKTACFNALDFFE